MFFLQLFASHVLACNRLFRAVLGWQSGGFDRNLRPRTGNLDICDSRDDFACRRLLFAQRYVFNRGMDELRELIKEPGDVRDSKMVLWP